MTQNQPEMIDVAIVGGGPAGLMAAETAARAGRSVVLFDAMPSVGRKFLMAGRSGLNITHSEDFQRFVARYGVAAQWMRPMLERFSPADMRAFCAGLDVETFVGTSGRVFPTVMKASPLLRAWLRRLDGLGLEFRKRSRLVGLHGDGVLEILAGDDSVSGVHAKSIVLALGGASWPRLGSTGAWTEMLAAAGVQIAPLRASNCAVEIGWSEFFLDKFEGQAIKTASFSHGGRSLRGEAIVTRRGIEGGAIYALSAGIGEEMRATGEASLTIDLKPDLSVEALSAKLAQRRREDSLSNALRKTIGLQSLSVALLRETAGALPNEPEALARRIKNVLLPARAVADLARAISTAGGIALDDIDDRLMLKRMPGVFVAGEMLDWDAPTGGYLLQACFATGRAAGEGAAAFASAPSGQNERSQAR